MKLRVTVDIELPEDAIVPHVGTEHEHGALREMIYDNLIGHAVSAHLRDGLNWMSQEPPEGADPSRWKINCDQIVEVHGNWADILRDAKWTVEKK